MFDMREKAKKDRGFILNISFLTAITGSPYNAQYGAGKSYIKKLTEAVAYEAAKTGVDVMAATLGTTLTPTLLKNAPGGGEGGKTMENALTPEQVADIIFDNVGKVRSLVVGEHNQETVRHWQCDMSADEAAAYMGSFYER